MSTLVRDRPWAGVLESYRLLGGVGGTESESGVETGWGRTLVPVVTRVSLGDVTVGIVDNN